MFDKKNTAAAMWRITLVVLAFAMPLRLASQEVRGAAGRWVIANISPEQAREKALEEAKKEALKMAGIEEHIKDTRTLAVLDANDRNTQVFNAFSSIELRGAVTDYTIVKDDVEKSSLDGKLYAVVVIDATVKKYHTTADPEFKIAVSGLRPNGYRNGDPITFAVMPNKAGFLKIFLFDYADGTTLLFPNSYEPNRMLAAKKAATFPVNADILDYIATKENADTDTESNVLLFVYTKTDIPFYGDITYPRILGWVNAMEPDVREVVVRQTLITK
jgi:hypothetical protein